jgi:hypothetical protein
LCLFGYFYFGRGFEMNWLGLGERGGFRSTKLSASPELDTQYKASFKHSTRFFAKRL